MSNPFKVGDKVVRLRSDHGNFTVGQVGEIARLTPHGARCVLLGDLAGFAHDPANLRAAIAGQDYPLPLPDPDVRTDDDRDGQGSPAYSPALVEQIAANSGHLSDGSSVQKHSAGALYPCVLTFRDAKLNGKVWNEDLKAHVRAKYDVGVISPRNPEPLWFSTFDRAVSVAATIKEDLQ